MPNRGSQSVHINDYHWLIEMYGETCLICGKPPPPGQRLEIDHISQAKADFDKPSNKSPVCGQCNCMLRSLTGANGVTAEEQHRRIIGHYRALRVKERAREREKSTGSNPQGSSLPIWESKIVREFRKIRKQSGIDVPLPDDSFKKVFDYMNGSPEMKANSRFFPAFAIFTWRELITNGPTEENELLNSGAAVTGANQTTLNRYLKAFCSRYGALSRADYGGQWRIYFKDPVKARKISEIAKETGGK